MGVKIYTSDGMEIAFGPVLIESGKGDDEFLRVESESNITEDVVGVDGEVTISRTNDRRATYTFIVMQTSVANDGLTVLANLAETAPGMAGAIQPMVVRDRNGRTLHEVANAWVQRHPDRSFAKTAKVNEWQIRAADAGRSDGGN